MGWWFKAPSLAEQQPVGEGTVRDHGTAIGQLRRTYPLSRLYWIVWPARYLSAVMSFHGIAPPERARRGAK